MGMDEAPPLRLYPDLPYRIHGNMLPPLFLELPLKSAIFYKLLLQCVTDETNIFLPNSFHEAPKGVYSIKHLFPAKLDKIISLSWILLMVQIRFMEKKTTTIHISFFIAANKPIAVFNNVYIICSVLVLFPQSKAALRCTMC